MASSHVIAGVVASSILHVVLYASVRDGGARNAKLTRDAVIEIENLPPPPPPPPRDEPPPSPAPEEKAPAPIAHQAPASAAPKASPAAPPPAEAGKTITANDDALADFTMVQGEGTYAGGITSSNGTSKIAVARAAPASSAPRAAIAAFGSGDGHGGKDASKPAAPVGGDWDCKSLFPSGALASSAVVTIVARVRPDGRAESVTVLSDPGEGFGAAARACAMGQRYVAAADREGRSIAGSTPPFRVRFTR